jgi:hypothetical protein
MVKSGNVAPPAGATGDRGGAGDAPPGEGLRREGASSEQRLPPGEGLRGRGIPQAGAAGRERLCEDDLRQIISYINDIRYGSVTVVIQDGYVLQIEKNEKIKL